MGWYVVLLLTLHIAYMCKKSDDSSVSYSWGMFTALKFKVDHVTWPRPFQGQFVAEGWDLLWSIGYQIWTVNNYLKWRYKGNAKCKNSRFEPPFGGLRVMHRVHLWLNGKCIVDFLFVIIELLSLALTAEALLSEICQNWRFRLKGWVTLRANFR